MLLRPTRLNAPRHTTRHARRAFTLMEVLVVVAIIFILASIASVGVLQYIEKSRQNAAIAGVRTLQTAVEAHQLLYHEFPASLAVLTQATPDGKPAALEERALIDPWGREFQYNPEQKHPQTLKPLIYSLGSEPGNAAGHIRNWQ